MCIREGPDHAPRFKATVNFNGEAFESPSFCTTLRQAEHSAAEVALNALSSRGLSHSLAARILVAGVALILEVQRSARSEAKKEELRKKDLEDETGVYKNLLQEVSQRVEASLPIYTTFRSGLGHLPVFSCTVELAGVRFTGEPAKNKKQAEKNVAMAGWSCLKLLAQKSKGSSEKVNNDEQEHVTVARALQSFLRNAKMCNVSFPIKIPIQNPRPLTTQPSPMRSSKILPLICSKTVPQSRPVMTHVSNSPMFPKTGSQSRPVTADAPLPSPESPRVRPQKFPATGAEPYIPVRHFRAHYGIAPPVTIRNTIHVFSAPPLPPPLSQSPQLRLPPSCIAPPVCIRQAVPVLLLQLVLRSNLSLSLLQPHYPALQHRYRRGRMHCRTTGRNLW